MDSWDQIWRRRGEMFAALGFSSAALWLSASVANPNSKVNVWLPLGLCGLLAVAGLYMMFAPDVERLPLPGRSSGAALRTRQSRVFERHVDDLHAFASGAFESIHIRSSGRWFATVAPIPFTGPGASDFRAHFPDAAALVDEWNGIADGYAEASTRAQGLCYQEAGKLVGPTDMTVLAGVLERVRMGTLDPLEVVWTTRDNRLVVLEHPDDDIYQQVCPIPDGPDAMEFVLGVWKACCDFSDHADVRDLRRRDEVVKGVRPLLTGALEAASRNHQPSGHCERCPQA